MYPKQSESTSSDKSASKIQVNYTKQTTIDTETSKKDINLTSIMTIDDFWIQKIIYIAYSIIQKIILFSISVSITGQEEELIIISLINSTLKHISYVISGLL